MKRNMFRELHDHVLIFMRIRTSAAVATVANYFRRVADLDVAYSEGYPHEPGTYSYYFEFCAERYLEFVCGRCFKTGENLKKKLFKFL